MFRLIAKIMVRRSLRAHLRGDVDALLKTFSSDVRFRFPGRNSWAGEFRGRDEVRRWLVRFHQVGFALNVDEIFVGGWPWNTRTALHFTDRLKSSNGALIYENTGFIYAKGAWGKIKEYEVVEDTEKVALLDEWLARHNVEAQPEGREQ